jgi:hypothetical protein
MTAFLVSVLGIAAIAVLAAKLVTARLPQLHIVGQIALAAAAPMLVAVILFIVMTVLTLGQPMSRSEANSAGMVVFAGAFFLVYALVGCVVIGLPSAAVSVSLFRRS